MVLAIESFQSLGCLDLRVLKKMKMYISELRADRSAI